LKRDKCPRCGAETKIEQDAYVREDVIVLHEVEKCPECGEIMLTEDQMDAFVSMNHLRSSASTLFAWEIVLEKIPIKRQLFCNMSVDTYVRNIYI
jgi:ribosomal protein S27AE